MRIVILTLLLLLPAWPALSDSPSYFPLEPGNQWKYRVTSHAGEKQDTSEMALAVGKTIDVAGKPAVLIGNTAYAFRDDGVYAVAEQSARSVQHLDPARKLLSLPPRSGDKWNYRDVRGNTAAAVLGSEKVETPAGEFQAFKVYASTAGEKGFREEVTTWFAPGVGIVRVFSESRGDVPKQVTIELLAHEAPGGKTPVAATSNTDPVAALFAQGQALARKGEHKAAIALYDQALALDAAAPKAHAWRALSLLATRRAAEAEKSIARALELNPKEYTYHEIAGQIRVMEDKIDDGAKCYDQAAALAPASAGVIYMDLAGVLASRNDRTLTGRIEQALKKSAGADPPHPDALFALGQMYTDAGRPEARQYLQRYIDMMTNRPADERDEAKFLLARQMLKALDL